jgi:hypothetical protein
VKLLKRLKLFALFVILLLLFGLIATVGYVVFNQESTKPFYVGVTYCGSSVQEAKELVDRVKEYTNLFVLQSGSLMTNIEAMNEIGDYATVSNLNYAVSGGSLNSNWINSWCIEAKSRWSEQFIGLYYYDESGGAMLDGKLTILSQKISKQGKTIAVNDLDNNKQVIYRSNGEIFLSNLTGFMLSTIYLDDGTALLCGSYNDVIHYYPNGTIAIGYDDGDFYTKENITLCPLSILPYETVLKQKPIQTHDDAAQAFVGMNKERFEVINKKQLDKNDVLIFTSDYGLYWWDYKGGYDVVLAELAWNHSDVQHIGLVRGAANLQSKSWGTILTWKYTHPPYLAGGLEMFEQMKMSYEAGAEYVIIFNYSEDPLSPNTLLEEHFLALERFWSEVVQNPEVVHGGIRAEAVMVLPKNYGWGMRAPHDNIWGMWSADDTAQEIWNQLQNKIDQYGLKLDIVFEDTNYSVSGKYHNIFST